MDDLQNIQNHIYVIRGQRVMLDFDLARIYQVETSQLKRQVRRNIERFEGEDFVFEVSIEELSRCQIGTLNKGRGSNQNDINESTRAQLDAISTALAELQTSRSQNATLNKRRPIGFIQPKEDEEDSGGHEK